MIDNPNRAKRRISYGAKRARTTVRAQAGGGRVGTTGVTVIRADPTYLARYGAAAAVERAERNARTGDTVGGCTVVARNRGRRELRSL